MGFCMMTRLQAADQASVFQRRIVPCASRQPGMAVSGSELGLTEQGAQAARAMDPELCVFVRLKSCLLQVVVDPNTSGIGWLSHMTGANLTESSNQEGAAPWMKSDQVHGLAWILCPNSWGICDSKVKTCPKKCRGNVERFSRGFPEPKNLKVLSLVLKQDLN